MTIAPTTDPGAYPLPTIALSNGEFPSLPQTETQKKVEQRFNELADLFGGRLGMDRRQFLRSTCGMAAGFLAMNDIYVSFSGSDSHSACWISAQR